MEEPARYISIEAYFKVNGIKVAEPSKEKPIPPMTFLDEQLSDRIRIFSRPTRCTLFDNWPLDSNGNLIW